jgi:hypothetical protein
VGALRVVPTVLGAAICAAMLTAWALGAASAAETRADAAVPEDGTRSARGSVGGERLRLSARPRRAAADQRTRFSFRVLRTDGSPVPNALVSFAGRRSRTGPGGGTRIAARLHRAGRRIARATRPGFEPAKFKIVVRRKPGGGGHGDKFETFRGSCEFEGTARFDPPLGNTIKPTTVIADAPGHCSGTLTDAKGQVRQLNQSPVLFHEESRGDQSCLLNPGGTGTAFLAFEDGARIDASFSESRIGPSGDAELKGVGGGEFSGPFMAAGDPVAIAVACSAGTFSEAQITASGSTKPTITG